MFEEYQDDPDLAMFDESDEEFEIVQCRVYCPHDKRGFNKVRHIRCRDGWIAQYSYYRLI